MSERPPQRAYDRLVGWLVSLPGRLRRAWRYGSAYYHGGTTQRIITYAIFLSLLVIFLVFFAGSVLGWMWQLFEPLLTSPAPAPTPAHPTPTPTPAPTPIPAPRMLPLFNEPARKFFETDVLRHFVAVGMAIWVSVRVAAIYFGDLHRIGRFRVASRLFRHMLLALPYGQLNLAQGALQTRQPGGQHLIRLLRVGVPVRVRIAADTCAVVEGIFAEPYVVGPTGSSNGNLLRGFSRLRRVVDLREHTVSLDVDGRTRDGLALTGRGLGLSFSVYRAGRPATDESVYPYDNQAI